MAKTAGGIAIYVRVSSTSQNYKSQKPDLKKWIKTNAGKSTVTWYEDSFTGTSMERPAFQKMTADIEAGRIRTVLVWRLNRIGRTCVGMCSFFQYLCSKAVNLVSIMESFDLNTPHGKMIAAILSSISEYSVEIQKEAQHAGIEAARQSPEGITWGGSKKGRVLIEKSKVKAIRQLHKNGTKIAEIARVLKVSRPTVYKFIDN